MAKHKKISKLNMVRVLLGDDLLDKVQKEADKEDRKLSPMVRRIIELHFQPKGD